MPTKVLHITTKKSPCGEEGLLIGDNPLCEIDGVPIGPKYCKIFVLKVKNPNAPLETPSRGLRTVGESVGRYIVWRFIHMLSFLVHDDIFAY
ncbi:unnamed protein product [Camellia sinensis]